MSGRGGRIRTGKDRASKARMLPIASLPIILFISGCVTTQPDAIKISVPVPVPCVKKADLPKPPTIMQDPDLAKLDDAKLILTIAAERLDLKRYATESSALLGACVE